jgi:methenyltetrahydrofolate cyclohydrolase
MNLLDLPLGSFLDQLGSASPAPGGGSIAALAGACAASLCAMVCKITLGKERHAAVWPEMREALAEAESRGSRLRALVQEDSDAFNAVVDARRLPQGTEAERKARADALETATARCAAVPLETLEALAAMASVAERAFHRGYPACMTDAATAAAMVRAGALAAVHNVRINLPGIHDAAARVELATRASKARESILAVTEHLQEEADRLLERGTVT